MGKRLIFKPFKFENDEVAYIAPSWAQMGELVFVLGKKLLAGKKKFDRLITMAKGGWTWSRTIADYLQIEEVGNVHVRFYTGVFETRKSPVIVQSLATPVAGERLLVFDDVADSGETLEAVKKYVELCGAVSIVTAALFYKSWVKFVPDYYGAKTEAWIVFPHEIREAVELIGGKWRKQGVGRGEIKRRLVKIGLPGDQVDFFMKG